MDRIFRLMDTDNSGGVDYRELNRCTVRKFFIIPNSDGIKATVAGSKYISVGDRFTTSPRPARRWQSLA